MDSFHSIPAAFLSNCLEETIDIKKEEDEIMQQEEFNGYSSTWLDEGISIVKIEEEIEILLKTECEAFDNPSEIKLESIIKVEEGPCASFPNSTEQDDVASPSTVVDKPGDEPSFKSRTPANGTNDIQNNLRQKYKHKCYVCNASFTSTLNLERHCLIIHFGKDPYECEVCKKTFRGKNCFRRHSLLHKVKIYDCDICKKNFRDKSYVSIHNDIHAGEILLGYKVIKEERTGILNEHSYALPFVREEPSKSKKVTPEDSPVFISPYECVICQTQFPNRMSLLRHERIHTEAKPYECAICEKLFACINDLRIHGRTANHAAEKFYECSFCKKKFRGKCHLQNHKCNMQKSRERRERWKKKSVLSSQLRMLGDGRKSLECKICKKKFPLLKHLRKHVRAHVGEGPYECKMCKKKFIQRSHLRIHKRIHTGESQHECKICLKKFILPSQLRIHERIHTKETSYESEVVLNQSITDERIHTGEIPYECEICKKQFSAQSHLKIHQRLHTGERPYECKICKRNFILLSHLRIHERVHSG